MTTATQTGTSPAPNAQPPAGAAAPPAKKPDLDEFLREFDTAQPPARPAAATPPAATMPPATPAPSADLDKRLAPIEAELTRSRQEREIREIDGIVETVRDTSDFLKGVDPDVVFGFLQGLGARDPRFRAAWMQRNQKPEAWANVLNAAAAKLEEKLRPVAAVPSADARAAVIAAARTSSSQPAAKTVGPEELRKMSDRELREYKRSLIAAGSRR